MILRGAKRDARKIGGNRLILRSAKRDARKIGGNRLILPAQNGTHEKSSLDVDFAQGLRYNNSINHL